MRICGDSEAIVESIPESLILLDHALCVVGANRYFFETFSLSGSRVIGLSIYELSERQWHVPQVVRFLEDHLPTTREIHRASAQEHTVLNIEKRAFQLTVNFLNQESGPSFILASLKEITQIYKSDLFQSTNDGIMMVNANNGMIEDVSPFLVDLLEISRTDLLGRQFWETSPLKHLQTGHLVLERLQMEQSLRFPEIHVKSEKSHRELRLEIIANLCENGSKQMAQFNVREIAKSKDFDQLFLQRARLESLGILASGIAHDFNNLLVGILGNAGLALRETPTDSLNRSALEDVISAGQRAAGLTRQMLAYAGKGVLNMHPLDFSKLVQGIAKLVKSSIPKSVELTLSLPERLLCVVADACQMEQVVMNLVINAAESIGDQRRGEVRVSTSMQTLTTNDIALRFLFKEIKPGDYVVLEVEDNGSGMDDNTRRQLFDPFFTTKVSGRGLGLAAVQDIVHGHHGDICVTSTIGKGSTIQIVLPAIPDVQSASIPDRNKFQDLHGGGLILLVDDEPMVLQITKTILELYGYRTLTAKNGELGVQSVRDHVDQLDLVILDSSMPVMGGEAALWKIKAIAPQLPVILSSGYSESQAVSGKAAFVIAGFVQKPYTLTSLLETVKSVLP